MRGNDPQRGVNIAAPCQCFCNTADGHTVMQQLTAQPVDRVGRLLNLGRQLLGAILLLPAQLAFTGGDALQVFVAQAHDLSAHAVIHMDYVGM